MLVEKKKETTPTGLEKETETNQEKRKAKKREREHETRDRLTSRSTRTPSGIKRRTRIETGNVYNGKTGIEKKDRNQKKTLHSFFFFAGLPNTTDVFAYEHTMD